MTHLGLGSQTPSFLPPPMSQLDLSASPPLPLTPRATHWALAPSAATFNPAVSSEILVENPKMEGLNFFRMSLKRSGTENTGERGQKPLGIERLAVLGYRCGAGGFWSFWSWLTSLWADSLLFPSSRKEALASVGGYSGFLVLATYWAVWCGSPRPHLHQCWGRTETWLKTPWPAAPRILTENLPWGSTPPPQSSGKHHCIRWGLSMERWDLISFLEG